MPNSSSAGPWLNTPAEDMVRDGFPGQRMLVVPRPRVREALARPVTGQLLVTDCGYFPLAHHHGRVRDRPLNQAIVLICVQGAGWCRTPAGLFAVHPGEVVVLPPRTAHAYGADANDPWTLWWLHVDGRRVDDLVAMTGASGARPVRAPRDVYRLAVLTAEVLQWMEHDLTDGSLAAAAGAAWHLFALLAGSGAPSTVSHELVDRAAEAIRQDVTTRIVVGELAATAGMSVSRFAELFRERTGTSVTQYQKQLRMARARELLDTTSKTVADIAQQTGYDDSFYFARQFKKVHGTSPSGYRRLQKG